jgi:transposase, IS5 family
MCRREYRDQLLFKDFFLPFGGQLSGDNRWIKLAELIPWDELENDYAAQFCKGFGVPADIRHPTDLSLLNVHTAFSEDADQ